KSVSEENAPWLRSRRIDSLVRRVRPLTLRSGTRMEGRPKSEGRNPKEIRNPNDEARNLGTDTEQMPVSSSDFGFRASFGFRISAFGFSSLVTVNWGPGSLTDGGSSGMPRRWHSRT